MSEVIQCPDAHETIWEALSDKDYRDAFAEAHVGDFLAAQIYSLRVRHDWNQTQLAERAKTTQPMICEWEKSCEGVRLSSLHKIASAFDVALIVKFVPFSQMAREAIETRADLLVPSFDQDSRHAIGFGSARIVPPKPRAPRTNAGRGDYLAFRYGPAGTGAAAAEAEARG